MAQLQLFLNFTCLTFHGQVFFYIQLVHQWDVRFHPICCHIVMEKSEALATAPDPPTRWSRSVKDTRMHETERRTCTARALHRTYKFPISRHHLVFFYEANENNTQAFFATVARKQEDGSLKVKVFRKDTHTYHR